MNKVVIGQGLLFGGNANNGTNAGFVYSNVNNAPSNTNTNIGSHLCKNNGLIRPWLLPKNIKNTIMALVVDKDEKEIVLAKKFMKRVNNIYDKIISIDNLKKADKIARKGKIKSREIKIHDQKKGCNYIALFNTLNNESFKNSKYETFKIYEPKEREIFKLPYYPDRILHHSIMNILEGIFYKTYTKNTYGCIKGRGVHMGLNQIKKDLKNNPKETKYCLKFDIKKYYPSVNQEILKNKLRKKIKDKKVLKLLDEIIDSAPKGIPIGNYLSQHFGNIYLNDFDHWLKEKQKIKFYYRYVDDVVILSHSKKELHELLKNIKKYLSAELDLKLKENYQIFPVKSRGIDFLGYVIYHSHVLLRKSIKKSFAKASKKNNKQSLASYYGWAKHCNSKNLLKKLNYDSI